MRAALSSEPPLVDLISMRISRAFTIQAIRISMVCAGTSSLCLAQHRAVNDLSKLTLEDLMNIRVTSVSKKEQSLSRTGAAVYVITQEDIRRSGATTIPDVLRMAPGVEVARIDINRYAITVRGFNDRYANKVLVLVDGRSVYNPASAGVFWDTLDVPLEDIERIEVIRGPGGTVWGANAVNGVISIITRNSQDTQGGLISAGTGSNTKAEALAQVGGRIGSKGTYRAFGRFSAIDGSTRVTGGEAADGWHVPHGGFRSDWTLSPRDTMMVEGDLQRAHEGQTIFTMFSSALPSSGVLDGLVHVNSGSILGRWTHTLANGSETSLQASDTHFNRLDEALTSIQNEADVSFQHRLGWGARQDIVWGLDARVSHSSFDQGFSITFVPRRRTDTLFSTFLQDEVKLSDSLRLTVGSKFERNSFTGFEFEPSAQLVWTPTLRHTFWASGARAVRQPSATEVGIQADLAAFPAGPLTGVLHLSGSPDTVAEKMNDFEVGYRDQINKRLSIDMTAFASYYQHLISREPAPPDFVFNSGSPYLEFPIVFSNQEHGRSYGGELSVNWNATARWRISPSLSLLDSITRRNAGSQDAFADQVAEYSPKRQFQVHSWLTLPHNFEWDSSASYVGSLKIGIPGYTRVDSRFGWRFAESAELSVVGQNLLTPRHAEFPDEYGLSHTLIQRAVFGKVTWRF